ncbi:Altered inheritance of mitochondria protein 18 [Fusarium oxysporum f. sp. albedinis]|nr:Altered inheritance of mitochondria protein 18 [Fusarium oxysporum f. sp. albedinis]
MIPVRGPVIPRLNPLGLTDLSGKESLAVKGCLCPIRLARFAQKAQRALKRSLDFSPVNHYRDHLHPTFEGRLTPAAQQNNKSSPTGLRI